MNERLAPPCLRSVSSSAARCSGAHIEPPADAIRALLAEARQFSKLQHREQLWELAVPFHAAGGAHHHRSPRCPFRPPRCLLSGLVDRVGLEGGREGGREIGFDGLAGSDSLLILLFAATPDFAEVYKFIGNVFDPGMNSNHNLKKLKEMAPIDRETVLLLMRNLSINLSSPEFEERKLFMPAFEANPDAARPDSSDQHLAMLSATQPPSVTICGTG